ncbi:MAG: hypothetical protein M3Y18_08735 [Candidatus Eremiobacteraeota bacterium]|nr:hypothetical protein [Candidatus Eremiobacteraeota bacterium]
MKTFCSVLAILGIFSVAPASAQPTYTLRIGPAGVGAIIFGQTPAQAAASGMRFTATKPAPGSSCFYLRPQAHDGLSFMVEHGTIRRAEVLRRGIVTEDGFKIGDPTSKIVQFFAKRARVLPNKYDPKAQDVFIEPKGIADAKYRMRFKSKNGVVQAISAGVLPQIEYVEGCA